MGHMVGIGAQPGLAILQRCLHFQHCLSEGADFRCAKMRWQRCVIAPVPHRLGMGGQGIDRPQHQTPQQKSQDHGGDERQHKDHQRGFAPAQDEPGHLEIADPNHRHGQKRRQRSTDHQRQRRAPLLLHTGAHGPIRMPTPCTVSIAPSQPASASLDRRLRRWLSSVRSETWIEVP